MSESFIIGDGVRMNINDTNNDVLYIKDYGAYCTPRMADRIQSYFASKDMEGPTIYRWTEDGQSHVYVKGARL